MKRLIMIFYCCIHFSFGYAAPFPADNDSCPSIAAIQSEGISEDQIIVGKFGLYGAKVVSQFDKEDIWTFVIGPIPGIDKHQAAENVQRLLADLEPPKIELYACLYHPFSEKGVNAIAIQGDIPGYQLATF